MVSRRSFIASLCAGVPAAILQRTLAAAEGENRPNIVYILADDMGYGDLTCLNARSKIHTKHLDRLASQGMVFRDSHSSSAVCTPTRYSILTGRYNWRSVLKKGVLFGRDPRLIEQGRMTAASLLKSRGYSTACIGKWHLGWDWARMKDDPTKIDFEKPISNGPLSVGFDYFYGIIASLDMSPYVYVENDRVTAKPNRVVPQSNGMAFYSKGEVGADFKHEEVLPNLTQRAVRYIEKRAEAKEPFFLYFPLTAPHAPILPSAASRGKSGTNDYGDFCLDVDDTVGQVMAALERTGIADNTIVIFTSDNGCSPMADFKGLAKAGHNPSYVFRGTKADIFEGGHRVPMIVRWPAQIKPASVSNETVCHSDFLATCAEITGCRLPDDAGEDSVSNLPVWQGKTLPKPLREATVHSSIDGSLSIRQGRWKLEMCPGSGGWSSPKGKECKGMPSLQLYDLESEIGERSNVYDKHPEVVERLKTLLIRYIRDGRSTPGAPQRNTGGDTWEQLRWMQNASTSPPKAKS